MSLFPLHSPPMHWARWSSTPENKRSNPFSITHSFSNHFIFSAVHGLPLLRIDAWAKLQHHGAPSLPCKFLFSFCWVSDSSCSWTAQGDSCHLMSCWVWILQCILTSKICRNESPWVWSSQSGLLKLTADLDVDPSFPGPSWGLVHYPTYHLSLHFSPDIGISVSAPHSA